MQKRLRAALGHGALLLLDAFQLDAGCAVALARFIGVTLAGSGEFGFLIVEGALEVVLGFLQSVGRIHALKLAELGPNLLLEVFLRGQTPRIALGEEYHAAGIGLGRFLEQQQVFDGGLDQTAMEHFNPLNAFDAEGLTRLTQEIELRKKLRNDIEQDTQVQIRTKNLEAQRKTLEIARDEEYAQLEQEPGEQPGQAPGTTMRCPARASPGLTEWRHE